MSVFAAYLWNMPGGKKQLFRHFYSFSLLGHKKCRSHPDQEGMYSESSIAETIIQRWHGKFRNGNFFCL